MSYFKKAASELLENDGLTVFSKGLGIDELFMRFLKFYCRDSHRNKYLVVLLNCSSQFTKFIEYLKKTDIPEDELPVEINSSTTSLKSREKIYSGNGLFLITPRLLIVDFLQKRLDPCKIKGILIYNAHRVTLNSPYSFILQLYKKENPQGFIKAFSEEVTHLGKEGGIEGLGTQLAALNVGKLFLWPRFREEVKQTFEANPLDIDMYSLELSPLALSIQDSITVCIHNLLQELYRNNKNITPATISLSSVLRYNFVGNMHKMLSEKNFGGNSSREKEIYSELSTLHDFLIGLVQQDPVTFYSHVQEYKDMFILNREKVPSWAYMEEADIIFSASRSRVYSTTKDSHGDKTTPQVHIDIEIPTRWRALKEEVEGIEHNYSDTKALILIACYTRRDAMQLYNILKYPISTYLMYIFQKYIFYQRSLYFNNILLQTRAGSQWHTNDALFTYLITPSLNGGSEHDKIDWLTMDSVDSMLEHNKGVLILEREHSTIYIYPTCMYSLYLSPFSLYKPNDILIYKPDLYTLRTTELYAAQFPSPKKSCIFFCHKDTAEGYNYMQDVEGEGNGFKTAIEGRRNIAVHHVLTSLPTVDEQKEENHGTILVDMREFNAPLVLSLYSRGFVVIPATLSIGDYILSRDICIERKEGMDLVSSLVSGRLYKQAENMCKYYSNPALLIMNPPNSSSGIDLYKVKTQLTVLIRSFPRLKLLWCYNDIEVVELFEYLKKSRSEPDLGRAMTLVFRVSIISDLADMALNDLKECMKPNDARELYTYLHQPFH
ncbi:hypothetical protein WA158_004099 [Blastocystis sp. Blastoise]